MILQQIQTRLNSLGSPDFPFDTFLEFVSSTKRKFVSDGLEDEAKMLWIYQTITEAHKLHIQIYDLLRKEEFYLAWRVLEQLEITLNGLRKHFTEFELYDLAFIDRARKNLQAVYPYKVFASTELLETEVKCNICNEVVSIRKPCGHIPGEIYHGESCHRIVTNWEVLGVALVENPVHKYSVMFSTDPVTNERVDHYNYRSLKYLMSLISSPYEKWDLEIQTKFLPHDKFKAYGRNDFCPCGSTNKYKKCCLPTPGVKMLNHEFIVKRPSSVSYLTNSVKPA